MDFDITLVLRLLWLPHGRPDPRVAFEVLRMSAPHTATASPLLRVWRAHAPVPRLAPDELLILTELDEPHPLLPETEFVLLLSFLGAGTRVGSEQFCGWRALSQEQAQAACEDGWGADLVTCVQQARELVQLPEQARVH